MLFDEDEGVHLAGGDPAGDVKLRKGAAKRQIAAIDKSVKKKLKVAFLSSTKRPARALANRHDGSLGACNKDQVGEGQGCGGTQTEGPLASLKCK
ncbi:hypothetical protein PI124_g23684 [Phytophthora idaei]|nr:hypothetical protein PI124_g23684 [Phytophthora idaei]